MKLAMTSEGVSVCPESAACVGAAIQLRETGWLKPTDRVVLYNCGAAQKYVDVAPLTLPRIPSGEFRDWDFMSRA
jgi:threonine synthase